MVSRAKKSPSRVMKVTEATVPAAAADPEAISATALWRRSVSFSVERPKRPSQPVTALSQPRSAPPGLSPSRAAPISATAWVTKDDTKPTTAPTMTSPVASTVATAASSGRRLQRASRSYTGCSVKPIRAPSRRPVAKRCESHAMTSRAAAASQARARPGVPRPGSLGVAATVSASGSEARGR